MGVLVTGFGPYDIGFDKADVNASWEGVQRIDKEGIQAKYGIQMIVQHLPVDYDEVQSKMTELWDEYKDFDLVMHVGLLKNIQGLRLEKQACKESYFFGDCKGCCPVDFEHPLGENEAVFNTSLDVDGILDEYNSEPPEQLLAEVSEDAGKFLCEYVYFTSLYHSESKRVMFVHVPHEGYSYEQIARGLERLLEIALKLCMN
ncbi:unnamed protein product [Arctia plantaginis]|uniref:Pyroglutamyl-peptidase I n=1 Tax=Arctia plantaginis TaxID=874455 RepID=A0A8S1AGT9_ARCPL|nr:unnamed protein product [Arctia plantaginis]